MRREILSTVSSVYDPLGFVAPFILSAKLILQHLCRLKLDWDDKVPEEFLNRWQAWLCNLPQLDTLAIERCFKPSTIQEITSTQLHHFSDASQQGYGAVSYLRVADVAGTIGGCRNYKIGRNDEKRAEPADQRVFLLDGQYLCTTVHRKYEQTISNICCKSNCNNSRRLIPNPVELHGYSYKSSR